MEYSVKSGSPVTQRTSCLVLGIFTGKRMSKAAQRVDEAGKGALRKILQHGDMTGETGQSLMLYSLPGLACDRILLVGCGNPRKFTRQCYQKALAHCIGVLDRSHARDAAIFLTSLEPKDTDTYTIIRSAVIAAGDSVYRFDQCKSHPTPPKRPLKRLVLFVANARQLPAARKAVAHGQAIAGGISLAKDLANLPGNLCTPTYLSAQARTLGRRFRKLRVQILEETDMSKLGMGALLSVSRGSRQPAKLIVMEYRGGKPKAKPVVLVGKGLTFDAGGISIKPASGMDEMKYDMCGGASVFGALQACVELGLPINLVGVVPSSENLPDGDANKPGDIVTSMSGQTIEVLNTDAEGRLILCDALTYCERFDPAAIIDIATLTGACVIALGKHASGLMSKHDNLAKELLEAGEQSGDRAWRLPLWDDYQSQLDSPFADMANIGGRDGGSITAGCFLSRFTKKQRWVHLDIAGTAWETGKNKGATGRPVGLLVQFLLKRAGVLA